METNKPDDYRRQTHAGIDQSGDERSAGKTSESERDAERNAEQERNQSRRPGDFEREPSDRPDLGIETEDQLDSF